MRPFVLTVCLLATVSAAFAQQPPKQYRLERIVVEGSKIDDTIVRGEARLKEERMYGEDDFQQAVYRVRRLPFVTDAVYRIEPGVTAGGTTLVIRILDVTPVFYDFTGTGVRTPQDETLRDGSLLIGGRLLLNNLGVVEGAVEKSDNSDGINVGLAYRAYDIMGTGAFGTAAIAQRFKTELLDYDPTMAFTVGYPLTQKQTVTLSAATAGTSLTTDFDVNGDDDTDDEDDTDRDDNRDLTDDNKFSFAALKWWYETIDDPIFATRGVQISGGPTWSGATLTDETYDAATKKVVSTKRSTEAYGLALDANAYVPLFARTVGFLRLSGAGTREQQSEAESVNGTARAGLGFDFHTHAMNVMSPWKARIEVGGAYHTTRVESPGFPRASFNDTALEAAFVMRHRWGTIRLLGTYLNE